MILAHASVRPTGASGDDAVLKPGRELVAAGYALYSSAVMLVLSWGAGVHGFTLDTGTGGFVLTHPDMRVPERGAPAPLRTVTDDRHRGIVLCVESEVMRDAVVCLVHASSPGPPGARFAEGKEVQLRTGQIYSVNDARYFDWPAGLRRYIDDIRQGRGQHPKQYSARYVCSLVRSCRLTAAAL